MLSVFLSIKSYLKDKISRHTTYFAEQNQIFELQYQFNGVIKFNYQPVSLKIEPIVIIQCRIHGALNLQVANYDLRAIWA